MWIFRRHRHLKLELLSEYLDGRLSTAAQARVSLQVDSCEPCRDELDSLRSTVSLLHALPELTAPRSFTLAAAPVLRPVLARQPLPLRAPAWAYAGAASLAGLALAIMVSADTLGLLTPTGQADFSIQSSERSAQPLQFTAAPEGGSVQTFRATDGLPESTVIAPAKAQPDADEQPETMALAAESVPGAADAAELKDPALKDPALKDPAIEDDGFLEKTAVPAAVPSEEAANLSIAGSPEGEPSSDAVLAPDQNRGTPIIWRVLEGIATALVLALLSVLMIKRLMSRRVDG